MNTMRIEGEQLLRFARYAEEVGHRGPVTTDLALRWAVLPRLKGGNSTWPARRLDLVRRFARHQALFDPATEVPPTGLLGPSYRRPHPHIYSEAQIGALLRVCGELDSGCGIRPHTFVALFGLLACTGMRISEVLRLTCADVDLRSGTLSIKMSKFRKSRFVPLHPSATARLRLYARRRNRWEESSPASAFFLRGHGRRLTYHAVTSTFAKLRCQLGWHSSRHGGKPRIHDFRHTFAVRRLLRWHEEGADVDQRIAGLSTYLGHAKVTDTYWYLTAVPELMSLISARFERFTRSTPGRRDA